MGQTAPSSFASGDARHSLIRRSASSTSDTFNTCLGNKMQGNMHSGVWDVASVLMHPKVHDCMLSKKNHRGFSGLPDGHGGVLSRETVSEKYRTTK